MTDREILMQKIATVDFAITDIHLFLNTHPHNLEMLARLNDYRRKSEDLRMEYEEKFGPITISDTEKNSWKWISAPWPWDIDKKEDC